MPSGAHEWLVVWLCRRMTADGFKVLFSDKMARKCSASALPVAPIIGPIRPDALAIAPASRAIAMGEAKTGGDLANPHTLLQLRTMLGFRDPQGCPAEVYLAFPCSARAIASRTILTLGLHNALRIRTVSIPDVLLVQS